MTDIQHADECYYPDAPCTCRILPSRPEKISRREITWVSENELGNPPSIEGMAHDILSQVQDFLGPDLRASQRTVIIDLFWAILCDKKIPAIKNLRWLTGLGLRDAKEEIEAIMAHLGLYLPEGFIKREIIDTVRPTKNERKITFKYPS